MRFFRTILVALTYPLRVLINSPFKLFAGSKRLVTLSLPARMSLFMAIFLFICWIIGAILALIDPEEGAFAEWLSEALVLLVLLVVIPIITYYGLKLWMAGDVSPYPEIDEAWNAGVAALKEQGIPVGDTPLFLVLGGTDDRMPQNLMAASGFDFQVRAIPEGRKPIKWFANANGIYVVANVGQLSALNNSSGTAAVGGGAVGSITGTMVSPITGTLVAGAGGPGPSASAPAPAGGIKGTLVAGADYSAGPASASAPAAPASGGHMSRGQAEEQSQQLRYLLQRIRRERDPLCALNGVLTLLPFPVLDNIVVANQALPGAVKSDLQTVVQTTQLRCPVVAVVTSMESEPGFNELVDRVGRDKAQAHRFGKGFHVWNPPTVEKIDALSSHAAGAFEDWVYNLFRESGSLTRPDNDKLFGLLCKIRGHIKNRLRNVLTQGFGFEPGDKASEPLLFGGCYFVASGDGPNEQAFVRSAIEKLVELEEELDWMPSAVRDDDRFHALSNTALVLNTTLFLGIVALLIYHYVYKP